MEPGCVRKYFIPVKFIPCRQCDCGILSVVYDVGWTLAGLFFKKIYPNLVAAPYDMAYVNTVLAQGIDRTLSDGVLRQLGDVACVNAKM